MSAAVATLTVDLDALASNFAQLRAWAAGAEVAPVIKADGYGLGAAPVARRLAAEGARVFYVARLAEGEALRPALPHAEIRVLDGGPDATAGVSRLRAARLTPVLSSLDQVEAWRAAGGGEAALHVDTGMNRLGLAVEALDALATSPDRLRGVEVTTLLSHLACADTPEHPLNARQLARFVAASAVLPDARRSLGNSAGVLLGPEFTLDELRPGIALYGGGPRGATDPRLRAVATLTAPVLQVRTVRPGESVGYGAAAVAERTLRAAVVGAGYADGVLRAGGGGLYAWAEGRRLPVLGRISMDLITLDASDAPGLRAGDAVQLLGPDVPVDEVAAACGTIAYEVLCRLAPRLGRAYVGQA